MAALRSLVTRDPRARRVLYEARSARRPPGRRRRWCRLRLHESVRALACAFFARPRPAGVGVRCRPSSPRLACRFSRSRVGGTRPRPALTSAVSALLFLKQPNILTHEVAGDPCAKTWVGQSSVGDAHTETIVAKYVGRRRSHAKSGSKKRPSATPHSRTCRTRRSSMVSRRPSFAPAFGIFCCMPLRAALPAIDTIDCLTCLASRVAQTSLPKLSLRAWIRRRRREFP